MCLFRARQILGLICGLVWGFLGLRGSVGIAGFAVVNAGSLYAYWTAFQQIDEEVRGYSDLASVAGVTKRSLQEFGGPWELTKEGFMTSFAGFLVTWIIIYSGLHF